MMKKLKC